MNDKKGMKEKIALGTAQFGLDYGINNDRGKIPKEEIFEILRFALDNKINTLDTAAAYGDSEDVLGAFIRENNGSFNIISKLPPCRPDEMDKFLPSTLKKLGVDHIYGYILHDFGMFKKDRSIIEYLDILKQSGKIQKSGATLYYTEDLEMILENNVKFDLLEVPYSVFDQRFGVYFEAMKKRGIEVLIRSVFLQGLVFKDPDSLDGYFSPVRDKLAKLREISAGTKTPVVDLCMGFAASNKDIDKIIVGVDNIGNLQEIIGTLADLHGVKAVKGDLSGLSVTDQDIILPFKWPNAQKGSSR